MCIGPSFEYKRLLLHLYFHFIFHLAFTFEMIFGIVGDQSDILDIEYNTLRFITN